MIINFIIIKQVQMKLRNVYVLCKDTYETISDIRGEDTVINSRSGIRVYGWKNAIDVLLQLESIPYLENYVHELIESVPYLYRNKDIFIVDQKEWNNIDTQKNNLLISMQDAIELYETMGYATEERTGLDIKLPECKDYVEFKKCVDELEFILYKCPLFMDEGETLRFENVDVGSMWLFFAILGLVNGVSKIMNNFVAFVDKCFEAKSKRITINQQIVFLKNMEMEAKAKQDMIGIMEQLYKMQVNELITIMAQDAEKELTSEQRTTVYQAMEKANELMDKGMQFYSSLDSTKDVKALFKPLEMKYVEKKDVDLIEENKKE